MKIQKLITGYDRINWESRVNEYLNDGWTVVPGTVQVSATSATNPGGYSTVAVNAYFAVVIEKE